MTPPDWANYRTRVPDYQERDMWYWIGCAVIIVVWIALYGFFERRTY